MSTECQCLYICAMFDLMGLFLLPPFTNGVSATQAAQESGDKKECVKWGVRGRTPDVNGHTSFLS